MQLDIAYIQRIPQHVAMRDIAFGHGGQHIKLVVVRGRFGDDVNCLRPYRDGLCALRAGKCGKGFGLQQIVIADEFGGKPGARAGVQLNWLAALLDAPVVKQVNHVAHHQRFVLVVSDKNAGDAQRALNFFDAQLQAFAQLGINSRKRLVQQQHLGPHDQAARKGHPLLLPARKLARQRILFAAKLHHFNGFGHQCAHLGPRALL